MPRHTNQKILRRIALIIGLVFGIFWLWFGLAESFSATGIGIGGIIEGLAFGGTIIILTLLSLKYEFIGGSLLVLGGIFVLGSGFFRGGSPLGVLLVVIPPIAAGSLFLTSWWFIKH